MSYFNSVLLNDLRHSKQSELDTLISQSTLPSKYEKFELLEEEVTSNNDYTINLDLNLEVVGSGAIDHAAVENGKNYHDK